MPKVRLSYDGWLALPAAVRKKLGLSTGYQPELVGGAIVLRPDAPPRLARPTGTAPSRNPSRRASPERSIPGNVYEASHGPRSQSSLLATNGLPRRTPSGR